MHGTPGLIVIQTPMTPFRSQVARQVEEHEAEERARLRALEVQLRIEKKEQALAERAALFAEENEVRVALQVATWEAHHDAVGSFLMTKAKPALTCVCVR